MRCNLVSAILPPLLGDIVRTFFFFQAEDGIRDTSVTGVQTCALPILLESRVAGGARRDVPGPDRRLAEQVHGMRLGADARELVAAVDEYVVGVDPVEVPDRKSVV